jgi:tRNA(Ile)-lysidine synthase
MILSTVRRTMRERALVVPGQHVLVACSGGPDSTVLLHVLHRLRNELGITLRAASIDHGLRPESGIEIRQVAKLAQSLGVPFTAGAVKLEAPEASLQARARELRYAALRDIAASQSATAIAVGHTRDDQAETVLARLLRGAGIHGLRGIEPRRQDSVIRPLIDCSRAEVRGYAEGRGLPFVDDPSNHQRSFERVRLRHELLPILRSEDPRIVDHLASLADEAAELMAYLDEVTPPLPEESTHRVSDEVLEGMASPVRRRWLRAWIARETGQPLSRSHLRQIGRLLRADGEVLLGSGWAVRREEGALLLEYREHRTTRSHRY